MDSSFCSLQLFRTKYSSYYLVKLEHGQIEQTECQRDLQYPQSQIQFHINEFEYIPIHLLSIIQVYRNVVKWLIHSLGNIDRIFCKKTFPDRKFWTFQNRFLPKPILSNISCETSVFNKFLLLWVVLMIVALDLWSLKAFKFTLFLHICILKMYFNGILNPRY